MQTEDLIRPVIGSVFMGALDFALMPRDGGARGKLHGGRRIGLPHRDHRLRRASVNDDIGRARHGVFACARPGSRPYAAGLPDKLSAHRRPLPFLFESNGSVTYFTNGLDPKPWSRRVFSFPRPETLYEWLDQPEQLRARLNTLPALDETGLWKVQGEAIRNLEESFADADLRALIQMATGSGKTFTAVNIAYRLLKFGGANKEGSGFDSAKPWKGDPPDVVYNAGIPPEFFKKITYRTGFTRVARQVTNEDGTTSEVTEWVKTSSLSPDEILSNFRNSYYPRIAVTVDMISTGTDVKPIECVFFLRNVRSAGFFEQMKGRGVRVISPDKLKVVTPSARAKERFIIVDGRVLTEDVVYVETTEEERERYPLLPGDLLFNTRNSAELVGKV